MRARCLASWVALAIVTAVVSLAPVAVAGQARTANATNATTPKTWTPPRTPDGHPDLQGVWLNNSATPLERPPELAGKALLTDDEVAELQRRAAHLFTNQDGDAAVGDNFFLALLANPDRYKNPNATGGYADTQERTIDNRTSLIVNPPDGKIPFTSDGRQRQAAAAAVRLHPAPTDPEDLPNDLRCLTNGAPRLGGNAASYNSYYQIVQTPGSVLLLGEMIHDARVIPMDGRPHLPPSVRQWEGDSRGRWEGDTLVVDTTNFSRQSFFQGSTEQLHLVERFSRVGADTINYEITVSDPTTWTQPWTAAVRLKQSQDPIYEYACHEGNERTMKGILAAARAAEPASGGASTPAK